MNKIEGRIISIDFNGNENFEIVLENGDVVKGITNKISTDYDNSILRSYKPEYFILSNKGLTVKLSKIENDIRYSFELRTSSLLHYNYIVGGDV